RVGARGLAARPVVQGGGAPAAIPVTHTWSTGPQWLTAVPDTPPAQWIRLWQILADLDEQAKRLRYLSQHEPLAQPTPGYPRAGTHRSHAGEVRKALEDILARFEELRSLVPAALSPTLDLPGIAADEHRHAL